MGRGSGPSEQPPQRLQGVGLGRRLVGAVAAHPGEAEGSSPWTCPPSPGACHAPWWWRVSPELHRYVEELVARAEAVRQRGVTPTDDNMLEIRGDGRKAALDLRLVRREPDGGKIGAAAGEIAAR